LTYLASIQRANYTEEWEVTISMKIPQWNKRFLASTRGQIIGLLRPSGCTVNELAESLGLTDNAVRAHLATLERDGLVRQSGMKPGLRKPHYAYELTPEAEQLFPKAYGSILNQILDVMKERLPEAEQDEILREVGRRVAALQPAIPPETALEQRLEIVAEIFRQLGGLAQIEKQDDRIFIRGDRCPLATVSAHHPQICRFAQTLVAEVLQTNVSEICKHGEQPQCCFQLTAGT
jgi:predicted ArsR family transcriptional regulator